ncbi:C40 family peptidase [Spongisporangium articulatum]|uniref:C40 family peptidase n=1 Tax=Spongisporangium articulatum TaxID=3362603 RepID=A0ABW8AJR1_9ACTN
MHFSTRAKLLVLAGFVVLVLGAGLVIVPLMMVIGATTTDYDTSGAQASTCLTVGNVAGQTIQLDDGQLANARTIISVGRELDVPARGQVVAVATALQESTLRNLDYGDRDSLGLFQQRAGWGSAASRTDPRSAAEMFYTGGMAGQPGLLDISGWTTMSITVAAQAVQRSAFPNAYARWESLAGGLVGSVERDTTSPGCSDVSLVGLPTGAVGTMLKNALAQQGDPYVWGAVGPDAFDCSGLVVWSWRQAGYRLNVRTAAQMWSVSSEVPYGDEQPGDLLFGQFAADGPHHVMIVVKKGLAVQAPETGRDVELTHYSSSWAPGWKLARFDARAMVAL